ncbi:[FeFe] hydrogenase H-cluster maturation GTPase HydF [Planctomycetota bacterium]
MRKTSKGFRLHIGLFGRRNVGKSSLLNAITRQDVSIVSQVAGTTTDPVEKPMEMLPLGPVLFIDTAGLDDTDTLGRMRIRRTRQVFDRTDMGILVTETGKWNSYEDDILQELSRRRIPTIVVFNKYDIGQINKSLEQKLRKAKIQTVSTIASQCYGIHNLREALIKSAPDDFINTQPIIGDLVMPGELAILVTPIDKEAPKGRLILPQVQTIRDLLDHDAYCMVVQEDELSNALKRLKQPPVLVVTDSQVFEKVVATVPAEIPTTSFSILYARAKGDLNEFVRGALVLDNLQSGDHVLVAEACSHHPIEDDIGRVKIPRWLMHHIGGRLEFATVQGHDFPNSLTQYKLIIHCGACMWNRREMLSRILRCRRASVPITNYGLAIAQILGIMERALQPFPSIFKLYRQAISNKTKILQRP